MSAIGPCLSSPAAMTKEDWDKIYPEQYLLHTIWQQVEIMIGNKEIVLAPQTYSYRAYLEALLGTSKVAKDSFLSAAGWLSKANRNLLIRPADETQSVGREFTLMGRLHLDLVNQSRMIIGGTEVRLKLNPNDPKFYFESDGDLIPTLDLKEVVFYGHIARTTPMLTSAHAKALSVAPARYPITRTEVRRMNISTNQIDVSLDSCLRGQIPRRMFIVLVDIDGYNGSYLKRPFSFHHNHVVYIASYIDGLQHPMIGYKPDFSNGLATREYLALFQSLNQNYTDSLCSLSYQEYLDKNTIFAFNFSPDLSSGSSADTHVNPIHYGTLRLAIKFKTALISPINVLMFCEFDNIIEIDENRQVTTSYN